MRDESPISVISRWRAARVAGIGLAILIVGGVLLATMRPRADRAWVPQHAVMTHADVRGSSVGLHRMRNFTYTAEDRFTPGYADRTYDLDKLESVWFIVTPFSKHWRGPAHTFVSFGFADSQYVAISVEARREPGETYGPFVGLFKQFELIYVIGDERDLIGSRAAFGGYDVYVYPIRTTRERIRALFVEMITRANGLASSPEFYNTLTNNCTSNVVAHVNRIVPNAVPAGYKTMMPGYTDEVAMKLGLIDTELDIERARERFQINARARRHINDPHFSLRIRDSGG